MEPTLGRRTFVKAASGLLLAAALPRVSLSALPSTQATRPVAGTGLVYDELYPRHLTPAGHPEAPARMEAIVAALKEAGLDQQLTPIAARDATDAEIGLVHTPEYLALVKREIAAGRRSLSTGDTALSDRSGDAALRAAGGVLAAVDAVYEGAVRNVFCAVRPPGHHASAARGMGFCIFNNIALAARYARSRHNAQRVLVVDWDVHHGNGTQDTFYGDGGVLFFDTHQSGIFPGTGGADETGDGKGKGLIMNFPLARGTGGEEVLWLYRQKLAPAAGRFRPQLVLISAGFDSRKGDPLGGLQLTDDDFAAMTRTVMDIAAEWADGRIVSVLEGGYGLRGLGLAASAHVGELLRYRQA